MTGKSLRAFSVLLALCVLALAVASAYAQRLAVYGIGRRPAETTYARPVATVYVSPMGDDRWSGRLARPDATGTDGPLATPARGLEVLRAGAARRMVLRGGVYRLAEPLVLGPGFEGVAIAAFPGEEPVLSGGEAVTGFRNDGGGLFSAPLEREPGLDVTFAEERLRAAQSGSFDPDDPVRSGWLVAWAARGGAERRRLRFLPGTVEPSWKGPGVRVQVLDRMRLADDITDVARIDPATRTLELARDAVQPLRDGSTFRLLGHPDFLRHPGSFAWRAADRRLLVRPPDGATLMAEGVVVARRAPLMVLHDLRGVTVDGLTFADVPYDFPALVIQGGGGHRLTGNRFRFVGTAIAMDGAADTEVTHSVFLHLGRSGVELSRGSDGNRIIANRFGHVGEVALDGAAILLEGASNTVIAHNAIAGTARWGIALRNRNADTVNLANRIEYNRIRDTGRETADVGAIDVLGRSDVDTGTVIRHNDIRHTGGLATDAAGRWLPRYRGFGIALDDLANGVLVEGNLLVDSGWAAVLVHGGDGNRIDGNTAVLTDRRERFVRFEWLPHAGYAGFLRDNRATGNVILRAAPVDRVWDNVTGGNPVLDRNVVRTLHGRRGPIPAGFDARSLGIAEIPWDRIGPEGAGAGP